MAGVGSTSSCSSCGISVGGVGASVGGVGASIASATAIAIATITITITITIAIAITITITVAITITITITITTIAAASTAATTVVAITSRMSSSCGRCVGRGEARHMSSSEVRAVVFLLKSGASQCQFLFPLPFISGGFFLVVVSLLSSRTSTSVEHRADVISVVVVCLVECYQLLLPHALDVCTVHGIELGVVVTGASTVYAGGAFCLQYVAEC